MHTALKRRDLIRKGALLTGALSLINTGFIGNLFAGTPVRYPLISRGYFNTETDALETTPPEIKARLLANENPFGPSGKAKAAISQALDYCYQYPMESRKLLENKILEHEGIRSEQLLMGAGSSPLLLAAALAFGKGTIVSATPTYEDLLRHAEQLGNKSAESATYRRPSV